MDTLSHFALGACLATAALGHRTPILRAALWGGVAANLPDLDTFIDHGEPVRNLLMHRADSHALLYLLLCSPLLGWLGAQAQKQPGLWGRWSLAMALALLSHPLLDLFTVYGTQLLIPFSREAWSTTSVFIIDPLVTLPLLVGLWMAWRRRSPQRVLPALGVLVAYLGWSLAAQAHVTRVVLASLRERGQAHTQLLITPTAFNTVLWRAVVVTPEGRYLEGFHSLVAPRTPVVFTEHDLGAAWASQAQGWSSLEGLQRFSKGFLSLQPLTPEGALVATDLRMGQEGNYFFRYKVAQPVDQSQGAETGGSAWQPIQAERIPPRLDVAGGMRWLSTRMLDPDAAARP